MKHIVNSRCDICGEPVVKCENTCSCLPCIKENMDCENCFNDIFHCFFCKIKRKRNMELKNILMDRRFEKLEEIREIEYELEIFSFEKDVMYQ